MSIGCHRQLSRRRGDVKANRSAAAGMVTLLGTRAAVGSLLARFTTRSNVVGVLRDTVALTRPPFSDIEAASSVSEKAASSSSMMVT